MTGTGADITGQGQDRLLVLDAERDVPLTVLLAAAAAAGDAAALPPPPLSLWLPPEMCF